MAGKSSDFGSVVKDYADDLRGAVEKVLAERPMLVIGLAVELGLLAGHWAKGNRISVADVARRALAATPNSIASALHLGGPRDAAERPAPRRRTAAGRRKPASSRAKPASSRTKSKSRAGKPAAGTAQ